MAPLRSDRRFTPGLRIVLSEHEQAVADFLATAMPRPARTLYERDVPQDVRFPVLSEYQMRHRLRREIPVGDDRAIELVGRLVSR